MKKCCVLAVVIGILNVGLVWTHAQTERAVVRLDPALDALVSADVQLLPLKSGFGFTEGLVWWQQGKTGYLVFSDIAANVINKMTQDGTVSVLVNESGYHGPWTGYALMRVGHPQNNGKDPKDPLYRE